MSKIEVNTIEPQCGTTLTVGKCTTSVAVPGNVVKTNAVQAADGGNIVNQSGTTITLGASGDTINLASGASQSGFGRTGTVDWQTGSIKTAGFTPTNGEGYFCDTSGGAFAVTLPAGSAGNIVAFADYTRTFTANNLTITPNGAEKIGGIAQDAFLNVNGQSATFVYVDGTEGWVNVQETQTSQTGLPPFIQATGGTPSQDGDYEIRTFTGPGTFCVTSLSPLAPENAVDYLIVGGGGGADGGSGSSASGGGAGGYRESPGAATCYTASPLGAAPAAAVTVTVQSYAVVVGAGGTGINTSGGTPTNQAGGNVSSVFSITGAGGGSGNPGGSPTAGNPGGSGGGGSGNNPPAGPGAGNDPPVSPSQGNAGGHAIPSLGAGIRAAGGGGGAGGVGVSGTSPNVAGCGGVGTPSQITGSAVSYAGGGGGTNQMVPLGTGGGASPCGTGGAGALGPTNPSAGGAGSVNKGGGGGAGYGCVGGTGGSGVVILRYKFQ